MTIWIAVLLGTLGVIVGGVINALADDLPYYRQPRLPHYPDDTPRPKAAWLGLGAFLLGKRHSPNNPNSLLSWRYPLVEIATGLAFALVVFRIDALNSGETMVNALQAGFWLLYVAAFILIFVTDVEHHLILFAVIVPLAVIALVDAVLTTTAPPYPFWLTSQSPGILDALLGGAIGFGVFFLFYAGGFLYARVSAELRGESFDEVAFGYGDVMLVTVCGFIIGWRALIFAMFITVFLGAAGAIIFLVAQRFRGAGNGMLTALPYGPYIIIGTVIMLLYSDWVSDVLLRAAYG